MGYSAVALFDAQTSDIVSPAAPVWVSVSQTNNKTVSATILLPLGDADGSELTGLAKLTVATAAKVDGVNPFEGKSMDEILADLSVTFVDVTVSPTDAGTQISTDLPIVNLGGFQAFAAAVSD